MMINFDQNMLSTYCESDPVLAAMDTAALSGDQEFTSHQWLRDSLPKRLIFHYMYGDLLKPIRSRKKVLDVGGGFTSLTRKLLENHDYQLLDIMAHDNHKKLHQLEDSMGFHFWINGDWFAWEPDREYDLIIANDLFPNVDQRLAMFLDKYLPLSIEIRLSLTYYNQPRWYRVRRTDGDEVFHMMAFDGAQTGAILKKHMDSFDLKPLLKNRPRLFPNGRQVCMVVLKKGRA